MINPLALPSSRRAASLRHRILYRACTIALLVPLSTQAEDLIDIYELAKENDATLQAAVADRSAAGQQLPLARSAFLPQISASATFSVNDSNDDNSDTFESSQLTLSLSQSLYNRRNYALLNQAKVSVLQADATLEAARQDLITRVASAYFDVKRTEADLAFNQAELEAIGRQRDQAEKRFDVGLSTVTDVREAQASYDLAVADVVAVKNTLATTLEALRVLSGVDITNLDGLKDNIPLVAPEPANIDSWVEVARDQNLDLATSRLELESSGIRVRAERGARFPTLDLLAIGSTGTSNRETEFDFNNDNQSGEIRLEVSVPLYTGGRINSEVARAKAEVASATANLRAQELTVVQQTRDSYRGVETNISRVKALRQALDSTQKSAEAADAGFRAGTRTSVDVLQALRDTFSARSAFVSARYDYVFNTLTLKEAAGTLNEVDLRAVNALLEPTPE